MTASSAAQQQQQYYWQQHLQQAAAFIHFGRNSSDGGRVGDQERRRMSPFGQVFAAHDDKPLVGEDKAATKDDGGDDSASTAVIDVGTERGGGRHDNGAIGILQNESAISVHENPAFTAGGGGGGNVAQAFSEAFGRSSSPSSSHGHEEELRHDEGKSGKMSGEEKEVEMSETSTPMEEEEATPTEHIQNEDEGLVKSEIE